jgi:soluble cytochrome b562
MKATVRRGSKKRLKSVREAKRDIAKAARSKKNFKYPVTETLEWVADGEKLLRKWGAIKSPTAKRIANGFSKLLVALETINELRKI